MKIVAAYLLAILGGNTHPSMHDIKAILGSVGIEAEDERIELLLSQVKGKDVAELVACGREKMASVPCGGSAIPVAAGSNSGGGGAAAVVVAEPVKEDKKEVAEESEDEDMCFSLFD